MNDLAQKLQAPFAESDIEWRIARAGLKNGKPWGSCLAYIDARAVQDRLDEVFGPEGWKDEYVHIGSKGVMCRLSLRVGSDWITKENGADETEVEAFKGGISKALVRVAATWGIGRYLYKMTDNWAVFVDYKTEHSAKIEGNFYNWVPPKMPEWALPLEFTQDAKLRMQAAEIPPNRLPEILSMPMPKIGERVVLNGPDPKVKAAVLAAEYANDPKANFERDYPDMHMPDNNPLAPGGNFGPTAPTTPYHELKPGKRANPSEPQQKRAIAIAKSQGWTGEQFAKLLQNDYKVSNIKDLPLKDYNAFVAKLEKVNYNK